MALADPAALMYRPEAGRSTDECGLPPGARWLWLLRRSEADRGLRFWRRQHELTDGVEYHLDLLVVTLLKVIEAVGQISVAGEDLPEAHEGSHDLEVDEYGPLAAQNPREHGNTLLGEGIGEISAATTPRL